jgi:hypothetical protein
MGKALVDDQLAEMVVGTTRISSLSRSAVGGLRTFAARLSDDEVAPIASIRWLVTGCHPPHLLSMAR